MLSATPSTRFLGLDMRRSSLAAKKTCCRATAPMAKSAMMWSMLRLLDGWKDGSTALLDLLLQLASVPAGVIASFMLPASSTPGPLLRGGGHDRRSSAIKARLPVGRRGRGPCLMPAGPA